MVCLADLLFYAGLVVAPLGSLLVLAAARLARPRVVLRGDRLTLSLGPYGWLSIPLSAARRVEVIGCIELGERLGGPVLPGSRYSGRYHVRGLGEALVYSDDVCDLLLVETLDGRRILLGYGASRLAGRLIGMAGGPAPAAAGIRIVNRARILFGAAVILYLAAFATAIASAVVLPPRIHFLGTVMRKTDALTIALILSGTAIPDIAVLYAVGEKQPAALLIALPIALGTLLMTLAVPLAASICPAA